MNEPRLVTISMNERQRIEIVEAIVQGRLSGVCAAEQLQLSERQISRLLRRYEWSGPAGFVSAKRCRVSNRELPIDIRMRAMASASKGIKTARDQF